jgi:ATP-binding cassette subfamily F protein uup
LSGGERNRLLLARLFARPANLMVLDEPTNDLDIETLELLEQVLVDWSGTLLLVSHDRTFLDHVVTSLLVFEGHGRVQEYTGGYEDWVRQRVVPAAARAAAGEARQSPDAKESRRDERPVSAKLSYREQQELEALPGRIEALEIEQRGLFDRSAHEDFYKETGATINATLARIAEIGAEIDSLYERWGRLDTRSR